MKNWQKVMEFCDQSWNFAPQFEHNYAHFANIKEFSIGLEVCIVRPFPRNAENVEFEQRDCPRKLFFKYCGA